MSRFVRGEITDRKALCILAMLMPVCFLPLIDKPFHIDEPMYLWAARRILDKPLDFYGFAVNWDGVAQPMAELMQNPPLSSYYLALLAGIFGWNESLLHTGFLVSGFAVVWGTYRLARDMMCSPVSSLYAALSVFFTPVFLVLANYVSCDMFMLAAWVWAIIFWRRALLAGDVRLYLLSGVLVAVASLSKYFGVALMPLLVAYGLAVRRRPGIWLAALLLPLGVLAVYQSVSACLYGQGLLSGAVGYAGSLRFDAGVVPKTFTGLAFTGGCLAGALFLMPTVHGKRGFIAGVLAAVVSLACILLLQMNYPEVYARFTVWSMLQAAVMVAGGYCLLVYAAADAWCERDPDSVLIFCWLAGTLLFTCFINWTISARNILPMAPAAGVMIARRMCRNMQIDNYITPHGGLLCGLLGAFAISFSVAWADYRHAVSARNAAVAITGDLAGSGRNIWFQGHWGFQYYMESLGMPALDFQSSPAGEGDVIIIPGNNSNTGPLESGMAVLLRRYSFDTAPCVSTMNSLSGAGFYTDDWGSLPFVFGNSVPETYQAFLLL